MLLTFLAPDRRLMSFFEFEDARVERIGFMVLLSCP